MVNSEWLMVKKLKPVIYYNSPMLTNAFRFEPFTFRFLPFAFCLMPSAFRLMPSASP
jgi:hypothetical protein